MLSFVELHDRLASTSASYPKVQKLVVALARLQENPDYEAIKESSDLIAASLGSSHPLARDFADFIKQMQKSGPVVVDIHGSVDKASQNPLDDFGSFTSCPLPPATTAQLDISIPSFNIPEEHPEPTAPPRELPVQKIPEAESPDPVHVVLPPSNFRAETELASLMPEDSRDVAEEPEEIVEPELPEIYISGSIAHPEIIKIGHDDMDDLYPVDNISQHLSKAEPTPITLPQKTSSPKPPPPPPESWPTRPSPPADSTSIAAIAPPIPPAPAAPPPVAEEATKPEDSMADLDRLFASLADPIG